MSDHGFDPSSAEVVEALDLFYRNVVVAYRDRLLVPSPGRPGHHSGLATYQVAAVMRYCGDVGEAGAMVPSTMIIEFCCAATCLGQWLTLGDLADLDAYLDHVAEVRRLWIERGIERPLAEVLFLEQV